MRIYDQGLTFQGFLALLAIFIESDQPQVPWCLLTAVGYDHNLKLKVRHWYFARPCLVQLIGADNSNNISSKMLSLCRLVFCLC